MLKVENISKTFGDVSAVSDLSFEVNVGEIVGLLGPNGAGKTTTMRIMSGFLSPDSGDVLIENNSIIKNTVKVQSLIGYLPENNPLYRDMFVGELVEYSAQLKGLFDKEKNDAVSYAVKAVNVQDVFYRKIGELSKGYKQRVGIALALVHKPKVLILDEPTEGLDPNQRGEIRQLIKDLAKEHTIIISTHVMQEVEAVCSRMVMVNKGKKVADGYVADIIGGTKNEKLLDLDIEGHDVINVISKIEGVKNVAVIKADGDFYTTKVTVNSNAKIQPEISKLAHDHNWTIWKLNEEKLQLEDIFKNLTKEI